MRFSYLKVFAAMTALGVASLGNPASAASTNTAGTSYVIRSISGSKTATAISLPEVQKAASAKFDELNAEHDGTLDRAETAGIMSYSDFTLANTKHDEGKAGTLSRDEYMAYVEKLFVFANIQDTGKDGTLSERELSSEPGVKLIALLKY